MRCLSCAIAPSGRQKVSAERSREAAGTSSIVATLPRSDLDYFTINVPANHEFTALTPATYVSEDGISFVGVQAGSQMTVPVNPATAAGLLVAIYAVIAYNYFVARINGIAMQYRLYAEEFLATLGQGKRRAPAPAPVPSDGDQATASSAS